MTVFLRAESRAMTQLTLDEERVTGYGPVGRVSAVDVAESHVWWKHSGSSVRTETPIIRYPQFYSRRQLSSCKISISLLAAALYEAANTGNFTRRQWLHGKRTRMACRLPLLELPRDRRQNGVSATRPLLQQQQQQQQHQLLLQLQAATQPPRATMSTDRRGPRRPQTTLLQSY